MATTIETLTAAADEADRVHKEIYNRYYDRQAMLTRTSAENAALYAELMASKEARKVAEDALFAAGGE